MTRALLLGVAITVACHMRPTESPLNVASPETEPVGSVDGKPLSLEEFNERYAALAPAFGAPSDELSPPAAVTAKLMVLGELIDEALVEAEATRQRLSPSNEELEAWIASSRPGATGQSLTPAQRARARHELLLERLSGAADVVVSEVAVESYYQNSLAIFERPSGASTTRVPLSEVRESIRASLTENFQSARRAALLRALRETIPWSDELTARYADLLQAGELGGDDPATGTPPPPAQEPPPAMNPLTIGR